jgi:hypothetical protein
MVVTRPALYWLLAQAQPVPQMPPTTKAVAMMALLGIALLGLLLVVFILLGGHWVRRIGSHRRGPVVPPDIVLKKGPPAEEARLPNADRPTSETFVDEVTDDTRNS